MFNFARKHYFLHTGYVYVLATSIMSSRILFYSEFTIVFKDSTLIDLYASVAMQMRCRNFDIYLPDSNEKVPTSPLIKLRDFIRDKKLKPIYSINRPCVYKLILDDKHI